MIDTAGKTTGAASAGLSCGSETMILNKCSSFVKMPAQNRWGTGKKSGFGGAYI
jgi:hypothetical protein